MVAKAKRRFRWPPRSAAWPGRGQGGHRSRRTANQLEPRFSIVGFSQLPAIREVARRECPIVGQPEYIPRKNWPTSLWLRLAPYYCALAYRGEVMMTFEAALCILALSVSAIALLVSFLAKRQA